MMFYQIWILTLALYAYRICSEPTGPSKIILVSEPVAVTFTYPSALLRFQPWDFRKYSKLDLRFNTRERQGILFFVGTSSATQDCIGIDIFNNNAYIYGILNEKEFRMKMNPNGTSVSDGIFHNIALQLLPSGYMELSFDGLPKREQIQSPVVLEFETYTYIGGIDSIYRLPWIAYSQDGFSGCIEYLRINDDKYIDIDMFVNSTETRGIIPGMPSTPVKRCIEGVCDPGKCAERNYNLLNPTKNFFCDCSGTFKTYKPTVTDILRGETCSSDSTPFQCDKRSFLFYDFDIERITHTDDISLDFKTISADEPFFFAKRKHGDDLSTFISSYLLQGQVIVSMKLQEGKDVKYKQVFVHPMVGLNDGRWHTLKIARYVQEVMIYVDYEANYVKGKLYRSPGGEKFYNKIREVYVGSLTAHQGIDKCSGTLKNLYWNEFDLLNTRNYKGRYTSQLMSYKPKLPPLPAFPRRPPSPCTIRPIHTKSAIPNVPFTQDDIMVMIEVRTKYDGIVFYAEVSDTPNDGFGVLIIGNFILIPYSFGSVNGLLKLALIRGGINIRDNSWHRIVVELSRTRSSITAFVDDSKDITKEALFPKPLQDIKQLSFSVAGYMGIFQYYQIISVINEYSPSLITSISNPTDLMFVGCLGAMLTNNDGFTKNLLLDYPSVHVPEESVICGTCQDVTKCPRNFCENKGKCFNINDNLIACNCSGTNFHGPSCSIKDPTCVPTDCLNNGACSISAGVKRCNCSETGFTGPFCGVSLCSNYNCRNNGICRIKSGQPSCDCSGTMFKGTFCEQPLCPIEFCKNNGKCKLDVATRLPLCDCQGTEYTGLRCENPICSSKECNGNGDCTVRDGKALCNCSDEFAGRYCENPVCPGDWCLNGGICMSMNKKPVCACTADFDGERCNQTKECPKESCFNGGACTMVGGKPNCDCSKTDYSGPKCDKPMACPESFCQNNGTCSVVQRIPSCNCRNTGYSGKTCENELNCPDAFCRNGGLCSNKKGKYICDCSRTGYTGETCDQQSAGIACPYKKPAFQVQRFRPPKLTSGMTTSMGFQTWMPTGTIFCYQTLDEKYWSAKLVGGKVAIDINGRLFYMKTTVNDGKYHIIRVNRDSKGFIISLDVPPTETLNIPIQITDILSLPDNLIAYSKLIVCNSCPDPDIQNQFQGSVGAGKSGDDSLFDQQGGNSMAAIGAVQNIMVPMNPLPKIKRSESCSSGHCKNGGKCSMKGGRPNCDCGSSGYEGSKCAQRIYALKSVEPKPGYVVHKLVPARARYFHLWNFLANFVGSPSPIATFILSGGSYLEFKYVNGRIFVLGNGVPYGSLNSYNLIQNVPHFFKIQNILGRLTMYINNTKAGAITLPDSFLMPNGSMTVLRIIVGANKNRTETIKGIIGGYHFNSKKILYPNGTLLPPALALGNIEVQPWNVIMKKAPKAPDRSNGSHGGMVYKEGMSAFANGYGVGAIVLAGDGPLILAPITMAKVAFILNPLALGFIVIILLVLSSIVWAVCYLGLTGFAESGNSAKRGLSKDQVTPLLKTKLDVIQSSENGALLSVGLGASVMPVASSPSFRMSLNKANSEFVSAVNNHHIAGSVTLTGGRKDGEYISRTVAHPEYMTITNPMSGQMDLNKKLQFGSVNQRKNKIEYQLSRDNYNKEEVKMNAFSENDMKVKSCILSENGGFAVTGSVCGPPQIWDLRNGDLIRIMKGLDLPYTSLHFALRGELLVGLVSEIRLQPNLQRLTIWRFPSGEEIEMAEQFISSICCISSNTTNCIMADETKEPAITILDLVNLESRKLYYIRPQSLFEDGVQLLKITNNGRYVITGFRIDQSINCYQIFDVKSQITKEPKDFRMRSHLQSCALINDIEMVVGSRDGELVIWDLESSTATRQLLIPNDDDDHLLTPHDDAVNCIEVSKDKTIMVSGGSDTFVRVWDMQDETLMQSITKYEDQVQCVSLSNDNEILVTGSLDGSIRTWNLHTNLEMCSFVSKIKISKVLISEDKTVLVGLGKNSGVNKLVMLKIVRNISKVPVENYSDRDVDFHGLSIVSPPL